MGAQRLSLRRLSDEERRSLLEVANDVVGERGKAVAVAAYGSKVAGYARPDSDYDIIVVAKRVRGKVKYVYVKEPVVASALVVEESLFEKDAKTAYLGEFVSGRLLNVYEPLLNGGLFEEAEVSSKRRVLAEELLEVKNLYGEFAQDMVIPLEYFLFNKLHKRALIYPPALYSYVRTYTCKLGDENRAFSVAGFEEAARSLVKTGIIGLEEGKARILGELEGRAFARLLSLFNLTTRGVRQYAVHGYVARVGVKVFKDEALSKAKRMRDKFETPLELEEPKRLISLPEGKLLPKTQELIEGLASEAGLVHYTRSEQGLGEIYSTARLLTLRGSDGREVRFVFKHFADVRSVKWALLNVWTPSRKFSTSPAARMHREYRASMALRSQGVAVPEVLGGVLDDKILAKEYVEGKRLSDIVQDVLTGKSGETGAVERFGESLGAIHKAGFALGDSKATNVIIKPRSGEQFFTDLEQAVEGGDMAWDVASFLYYQAKLSFREAGMKKVADAFLRGYKTANGSKIIDEARSPKYVTPFRPLTAPPMLKVVSESLTANAS